MNEERKAYNREYYHRNKHRWTKRSPERQSEYNATRRRKYAESAEYRAKAKAQSDAARAKNPDQRKLKQYGLTAEHLELLTNAGCAICGASFEHENVRRHIDHDHRTGQTRGVLCQSCNLGIGHFQDDPITLLRAVDYLMKGGSL